jgi:hypothetical protein
VFNGASAGTSQPTFVTPKVTSGNQSKRKLSTGESQQNKVCLQVLISNICEHFYNIFALKKFEKNKMERTICLGKKINK